jgi:hypothetical protein
MQTRPQKVEFSLTQGPFQTQQHPIIEIAAVVQPIFIQDQGVGQGTQFQQTLPIR